MAGQGTHRWSCSIDSLLKFPSFSPEKDFVRRIGDFMRYLSGYKSILLKDFSAKNEGVRELNVVRMLCCSIYGLL